jgi:type IVB pilus formation R64 PilN family outer membrane protein
MREVARYIRQQQEMRLRQIAITVQVLNVRLNRDDEYSLNLNAVFNNMSTAFKYMSPMGTIASNAGNANIGIVNPSSNFNGSQAIVQALSTQGDVSIVSSAGFITLNDQEVPVQVGTQTSYLASVSQTLAANVGTTAQLVPGTVTTGISMNLLPRVLSDGRLLMQFTVTLSDLKALTTVSSGGNSIQVPEVDTRTFINQAIMNSHATLILSGFEQVQNTVNATGTGWPWNLALGGAKTGNQSRDITVILITPEAMPGKSEPTLSEPAMREAARQLFTPLGPPSEQPAQAMPGPAAQPAPAEAK